jgi:hypothetical protein
LPGLFSKFEKEMNIQNAIKYCKRWIIHRRWLKANNVKFDDFKGEIKFNKLCKEFRFDERAVRVQVTKSIEVVAKRLAAKEILEIRAKNAMIRDRKMFLERQADWQRGTQKTAEMLRSSIRE